MGCDDADSRAIAVKRPAALTGQAARPAAYAALEALGFLPIGTILRAPPAPGRASQGERAMKVTHLALPAAIATALAACGVGSPGSPSTTGAPLSQPNGSTKPVPTYFADIKPIIDARCTNC